MRRMIWMLAGGACAGLALGHWGQLAGAQPEGLESGTILEAHSAGLDAIMPDDRDAGLRRALMLMGPRLARLQQDFQYLPDAPDLPPVLPELVWNALMSPMSLSLGIDVPANGPPQPRVQFVAGGDDGATSAQSLNAMAERFVGMMMGGGDLPPQGEMGLRTISMPNGALHFGLGAVDGRERFVVSFGRFDGTEPEAIRANLDDGLTPVAGARLDLAPISGMLGAQIASMPDGEAVAGLLETFGLIGEDPISIECGAAFDGTRAHVSTRMANAMRIAGAMGIDDDISFDPASARSIPADVSSAAGGVVSVDWILPLIDRLRTQDPGIPDIRAEIQTQIGIDIKTQLLDPLGTDWTVHLSSSTGGGLLSTVFTMELDDPGVFADTHAQLVGMANGILGEMAEGWVQVRQWTTPGGDTCASLIAPGLPIPVEPVWGIKDDRLVVAASRQALIETFELIGGGDGSLAEHPRVRAILQDDPASLLGFSFADSQWMIRKGYPTAMLGATALGGMVRDRENPEADAGVIMPPMQSLLADAQPTLSQWRRQGADMVMHTEAEASWVSNIAVAVGASSGYTGLYMPAMLAGILLPALGQARENAEQIQAATQTRMIAQAVIDFSIDGDMPESLQQLVDEQRIGFDTLQSPRGPSFDGGPDFAFRFDRNWMFDSDLVVGVERCALVNGEEFIHVAFGDGRVEALYFDNAWELIAEQGLIETFGLE